MNSSDKVSAYVEKHPKWKNELNQLRVLFRKTELTEEVKWGAPSYELNGKLVAGLAGFKNHMGIWFHQGVFLKDSQKKLLNAQEGKTKALRQWRFAEGDTIEEELVLAYIEEAIANCKTGKEMKPERGSKKLIIPEILENQFKHDSNLHKSFLALTPGKQREYADYISEAKREATQTNRITKIIPMIVQGIGLNDQYKNC